MNGIDRLLDFLEKNTGGKLHSPRALFGDDDAGDFEIVEVSREKEYVAIRPDGGMAVPVGTGLLSEAADLVLDEGVVSMEPQQTPGGPVVLVGALKDRQEGIGGQTLDTKYIYYIADMIVLSGVAAYGWAKTPDGEKFRAIAVKKAGRPPKRTDRLARNGFGRPKVKDGGAYTKENAEVLVTYATKHGSTTDIAWSIANSFFDSGIRADVKKIQNVEDVRPYRLVIVGTPIYDNQILPEVLTFAELHTDWLEKRKVAVFVVGRTLKEPDSETLIRTERMLSRLKNYINIFDTGMFAGKISPKNLPIKERLEEVFGEKKTGDFRDWEEIGSWAKELEKKVFSS